MLMLDKVCLVIENQILRFYGSVICMILVALIDVDNCLLNLLPSLHILIIVFIFKEHSILPLPKPFAIATVQCTPNLKSDILNHIS